MVQAEDDDDNANIEATLLLLFLQISHVRPTFEYNCGHLMKLMTFLLSKAFCNVYVITFLLLCDFL